MQTVERQTKNVLPILDEIDRLYGQLSEYQFRTFLPEVFDSRVIPIVDKFNIYSDTCWEFDYARQPTTPVDIGRGDKVLLCFSGGRDSIVSLMKYQQAGMEVALYHMHGVNASQSDEQQVAEQCAKHFGVELITDVVHYHGHNIYMEHPMKNIIIAGGALNYSLSHGIGYNIAFGNYTDSKLADVPFHVCAGDCVDMWGAYEDALRADLPEFKVGLNLQNLGETMDAICGNDALLDMSISCLCRHSLRDYRRDWVRDKFGVVLPKHRCGSCAKCTAEYIYRADHEYTPFNESYYRYCMEQLYKVTMRGEGDGQTKETPRDVFETFLFYPFEQSKMYEQLQNATLRRASIAW